MNISTGTTGYNQIPDPRDMGSKLLKALSVTPPKVIPSRGISVFTRKKLEPKRKKP